MVPESKNGISGRLWPNNRIPYVISAVYSMNFFLHYSPSISLRLQLNSLYLDANQRQIIASAMNEYVKNTCITFVERTDEPDYIVITEGGSG